MLHVQKTVPVKNVLMDSLRLDLAVCRRIMASGRVNTLDASTSFTVEMRKNDSVHFGSKDQHGPFGRV